MVAPVPQFAQHAQFLRRQGLPALYAPAAVRVLPAARTGVAGLRGHQRLAALAMPFLSAQFGQPGIQQFREPEDQRLDKMLTQPFRGDVGAYPINRR